MAMVLAPLAMLMALLAMLMAFAAFSDAVVTLNYGNFISAIINFLILALVVFFLVKGLNKLSDMTKKKEEEAPAAPPAPPAPSAEEVLLTEIRDLLKNK